MQLPDQAFHDVVVVHAYGKDKFERRADAPEKRTEHFGMRRLTRKILENETLLCCLERLLECRGDEFTRNWRTGKKKFADKASKFGFLVSHFAENLVQIQDRNAISLRQFCCQDTLPAAGGTK